MSLWALQIDSSFKYESGKETPVRPTWMWLPGLHPEMEVFDPTGSRKVHGVHQKVRTPALTGVRRKVPTEGIPLVPGPTLPRFQ